MAKEKGWKEGRERKRGDSLLTSAIVAFISLGGSVETTVLTILC